MFSAIRGELHFPAGRLAAWKASTVDLSAYVHVLECLYPVAADLPARTVGQHLSALSAIGVDIDEHAGEVHFGGDSKAGGDIDSFVLAAVVAHAQEHGGEGELFMMDGEREGHGQLFCVLVEVHPDGADASTLSDAVATALQRRLHESGTLTRDILGQTLRALGLESPSGRAQTFSD
jgi:hypothetical protein